MGEDGADRFSSPISSQRPALNSSHKPFRAVFRDAGFADSAAKINVEQIFKLLSPATEVKCI
jgi:hypothetical protein